MAVLAFDQYLRIYAIVHGVQARLVDAFFSLQSLRTEGNPIDRRTAADALNTGRLADQLRYGALPWLDRFNRMVLHTQRALRDLKGSAQAFTVANCGQLNVGQSQTNTAHPRLPGEVRAAAHSPASKQGGDDHFVAEAVCNRCGYEMVIAWRHLRRSKAAPSGSQIGRSLGSNRTCSAPDRSRRGISSSALQPQRPPSSC